jgi:hypothetical protein
LLNDYSTVVYGRTFTYTSTNVATATRILSGTFTSQQQQTLEGALAFAGAGAFGTMSNGQQTVLASISAKATNDAEADIAANSLAAVSITGFAVPTSQDAALAQVYQVAPAFKGLTWTATHAPYSGTYNFKATTTRTFNTQQGPLTVTIAISATVWPTSSTNAVVSILTGTGPSASRV